MVPQLRARAIARLCADSMKRYGSPSGAEHSASKRNIRDGEHPAYEAQEAEAEGIEAEEVFTLMFADRGVPSPDIQEIVKLDKRERLQEAELNAFYHKFDPDVYVEILKFSSREVGTHRTLEDGELGCRVHL